PPAELAERSATAEPYAREWLNAQAAGGYVTYDPASGRYTLPPEQAVALTVEDSPAFLPGLFQLALGTVHDVDHVLDAARSGGGYGWHEHVTDVHVGRSEEHTSELQSRENLVCRLLLEKKKQTKTKFIL